MAKAYPDQEPFICAAAEALKKYRPNTGWDLLHLSELLMFFALDGYEAARQALEEKYEEVLAWMLARKRRPNRVFNELSDLEQLGLVLAVDRKSFLRIAKDFGRLYREKSYMEAGDFAWFFDTKGAKYRKSLERAAKSNEEIACLLHTEKERSAAWEEQRKQRFANPTESLSGVRLSRWLSRKADKDTLAHYALAYRQQAQPELRAEALAAFSDCAYPDDPHSILEDTRSECEALQCAAWNALENIRHQAVRQFAINNALKGVRTPENFAVLAKNYLPEDCSLVEELLRELIEQRNWDDLHTAGIAVYQAFYIDSGIPHPKHLLPLLYEFNPCSYCRETAVQYMSRHRMLTREMLEECQFDCNEDIRKRAEKQSKQTK